MILLYDWDGDNPLFAEFEVLYEGISDGKRWMTCIHDPKKHNGLITTESKCIEKVFEQSSVVPDELEDVLLVSWNQYYHRFSTHSPIIKNIIQMVAQSMTTA